MLRNILVAALAASAVSAASSSDPCSADSTTINAQSDLDALSSCKRLTGDLVFGPGLVTATINYIQSIGGDLVINNATLLQSLSAPYINAIDGTFKMTSLTALSSLSFPVLSSVGSIYWQTLPALQQLSFGATITDATSVVITDTILESLEGINLVTVASFNINNNRYLKDVTVQLTNVTDSLSIEFNGAQVAASFPNLTWANNATFRSCGSVSLPNLQVVNGSIGFFENSFTELDAPKLTAVGINADGGDVTFANNDELTNVSMPLLTTIHGTLQFVNDSSIEKVNGFPKLATIFGSIDLSGKFDDAEFPSISDVRGGFNLQTTSQIDCSTFDKLHSQGTIHGDDYVCQGAVTNPGTEGSTPTSTGGGSSQTGTGHNAAGRLSAGNSFAAIPAVALFAALFL